MSNLSIFNDGTYIIGVDYSKRDDCIEVIELSSEDYTKIKNGTHYFDVEKREIIEKQIETIEEEIVEENP